MTAHLQPHEPERRNEDQRDLDAELAKHHDVFVSYKRDDFEIRDHLVEALEAAGLSVWWDAKLRSGPFRTQLAEKINTSKLVVALWSQRVEDSQDEVRDEMSQARGLQRLMVLRTDEADIPKLFREQNFMAFDGWADETRRAAQLVDIVDEVRRKVAAPTAFAMRLTPLVVRSVGILPKVPLSVSST